MKNITKRSSLFLFLAAIFMLVGCAGDDVVLLENPVERKEFLMGTYVIVQVYDEGKEAAVDLAFDRIKELEEKITVNEDGTELYQINQNAGKSSVKVSDDLFELLERSAEYSESPADGFDYTIGPIVDLWRIGYDDARLPSQDEIDAALSLVEHEHVQLNADEKSVYLEKLGMSIDLGAIAKGYIADEAMQVLIDEDVTVGMVDLGGNLVIRGDSPRREEGGWNVGVQDPFSTRGEIAGFLNLKDRSIVTSGIYERYLEVDGVQYHHLLSPETGYPFDNDIAGVTIISEKSIDGDALSTGVFSLGLEEGLAYVNGLKNIEAVFVTKDRDLYTSDGITATFNLSNTEFNWVNEGS